MDAFPRPEKTGQEILAVLLENERKRIAKGKPPHFAAGRLTFSRAEWALVTPWRIGLESALEDGLDGVELLRQVLLDVCDADAYEQMKLKRKKATAP